MIIEEVRDLPLELAEELTELWEGSVRATHHFLSPDEILEIKPHVKEALLHCKKVLVLMNDEGAAGLAAGQGAAGLDSGQGAAGLDSGQGAAYRIDPDTNRANLGNKRGFLAIDGQKIDMFFLAPESLGKGHGKKMLEEALLKHGVKFVDVNEENIAAQGFYRHMGFTVYERSELDDTGMPYPLLHMVRL